MSPRPARAVRTFTQPPTRGRPYVDAQSGQTMILPRGGGKAIPYVGRSAPARFSGRRALKRAGLVADRGLGRTGEAGLAGARRLPRQLAVATGTMGAGELLLWVGFTILGLALFNAMIGGRGPAGVQKLLELVGGGIQKLFAANEPLVAYAASAPVGAAVIAEPTASMPSGGPESIGGGGQAAPKTTKPKTTTKPATRTSAKVPLAGRYRIGGGPGVGSHSRSASPNNWQSDNAVDLLTAIGTPVRAVATGVIGPRIGALDSSNPRMAGLRLTLVGSQNEFYYAHLSRLVVKAGQRVKRGQLLGYSGSAAGVAHLHFASRRGDPRSYLGLGRRQEK